MGKYTELYKAEKRKHLVSLNRVLDGSAADAPALAPEDACAGDGNGAVPTGPRQGACGEGMGLPPRMVGLPARGTGRG